MTHLFTEISEEGKRISVEYRVNPGEKVGITGICICDGNTEEIKSPALFFTEEEAECWCVWLSENKVLPSSLNDILSDELYISKSLTKCL